MCFHDTPPPLPNLRLSQDDIKSEDCVKLTLVKLRPLYSCLEHKEYHIIAVTCSILQKQQRMTENRRKRHLRLSQDDIRSEDCVKVTLVKLRSLYPCLEHKSITS